MRRIYFREQYIPQTDKEREDGEFPPAGNSPDYFQRADEIQFRREFHNSARVVPLPDEHRLHRIEITPVRVRAVPLKASILVANKPQLYLNANLLRRRFIICNPATAAEILNFSFLNTDAYLPLVPGAVWDESGTTGCFDQIWVVGGTVGHIFTGYEFFEEKLHRGS